MALAIEKLNGNVVEEILDYLGPQDRISLDAAVSEMNIWNRDFFRFNSTAYIKQLEFAPRNADLRTDFLDNIFLARSIDVDSSKYVSMMPSKLYPYPESGLDTSKTYAEHYSQSWEDGTHFSIAKLKKVDLRTYRKDWLLTSPHGSARHEFQAHALAKVLDQLAKDKTYLPGTCRTCLVSSSQRYTRHDDNGFPACRRCFNDGLKLRKQKQKMVEYRMKKRDKAFKARVREWKKVTRGNNKTTSKTLPKNSDRAPSTRPHIGGLRLPGSS